MLQNLATSGIVCPMPITTSAKKALRASARKRVFNQARMEAMRESIKNTKKTPTAETLKSAYKAIDKAAQRGVIKKNHAARRKSRLAALLSKANS